MQYIFTDTTSQSHFHSPRLNSGSNGVKIKNITVIFFLKIILLTVLTSSVCSQLSSDLCGPTVSSQSLLERVSSLCPTHAPLQLCAAIKMFDFFYSGRILSSFWKGNWTSTHSHRHMVRAGGDSAAGMSGPAAFHCTDTSDVHLVSRVMNTDVLQARRIFYVLVVLWVVSKEKSCSWCNKSNQSSQNIL